MRRPRFDIGELRAFLEEKLETRFVRFDLITTCSRPENFRAETADGRRLAVKCVPAEKTRIRYFADHFVPHLEELRGSRAIQLVGSPLKFADCTVAVVEWCPGRRVMPDRLTDAQFAELVSTYREFSASLQNVSQVLPPRPNLKVREKALAPLSAPSCRWLRDFVERALTDGVLAYDASRLRVIHGDFHHGNFHFDGNRMTGIMDLEDFRYGYPADDWMRYIEDAANEAAKLGFRFVQAHSPSGSFFKCFWARLTKPGNTTAGVDEAELKYLSLMVELMLGFAFCWISSNTENRRPRT